LWNLLKKTHEKRYVFNYAQKEAICACLDRIFPQSLTVVLSRKIETRLEVFEGRALKG
jgi:hypothetical protein